MDTVLLKIDPAHPESTVLERAAAILRQGGLVAFPTETVYGLGALALSPAAVARIFEAKGRPSNNPVIVHVADTQQARSVTAHWPEAAARLAERFWPGPLTLILPRTSDVPDAVTAGGPTVAVRVPAHPVALALIRAAGQPIAAPSANRSTAVSPTRAHHVLKTLNGRIDLVLDGGPCQGGIESTVLSLADEEHPVLLRPGLVSRTELESVLGIPVRAGNAATQAERPEVALPSPGMMERHYAPSAPVVLTADSGRDEVEALIRQGKQVGWLPFQGTELSGRSGITVRPMPGNPEAYAAALYASLYELDAVPVDVIVIAAPPRLEEWRGVRDRLQRASVPE